MSLVLGNPFCSLPPFTNDLATAGVGLDMALSKGLELVQREDFEREVCRAVVATREEYFQVMEAGTMGTCQCQLQRSPQVG